MNSSTPQVLDILLGGMPNTGKVNSPELSQSGDDLFNRLFGQLLNSKGQSNNLISNLSSETVESIDLLGLNQNSELLSEAVENQNNSLVGNLSSVNGSSAELPLLTAIPIIKNSELSAFDMKALQGKFDIINAEQNGDQITLTLSSQDSAETESNIKLNISAKALEQILQSNQQPGNSRVLLDGINHLESVLKELDLKEIKLELDVDKASLKNNLTSRQIENTSGLKVSLVAEQSGQLQTLKGKLQKGELSVDRLTKQPTAEPLLNTGNYGLENKSDVVTAGLLKLTRGQQLLEKAGNNMFSQSSLDSTLLTDEYFSQNSTKGATSLSVEQALELSADNKVSAAMRPARFVFPEQAAMQLRPNGQSISLTIDPEHLGTARLRLVMHENNLIARVVVDSALAKSAVESGLDRLTEQLSQANIEVESIEVSVGGDDTERGQFDQMAFWQHRNRIASLLNPKENEIESMIAPMANLKPSVEYLRADGINMLA